MKKSKKGFTLAELLVVVAIIAVLVAIAIPVFSAATAKAKQAADAANIRAAYAQAVTNQLVSNTAYPGASASFVTTLKSQLNYPSKLTWTGNSTGLTVKYTGSRLDPSTLSLKADVLQ